MLSVSVVVCAYNYERFVAEAIDSALGQDHPGHLEVVVVDDGSTDRTPEILAGYGDRIRVVHQVNAGLNAATARGIAEARGDVVALLDADDVWRPGKARLQAELLAARPEVGLVFSDMDLIDADGAPVAPSYFARHGLRPPRGRILGALLEENLVPAPTIAFRRSLADHVLPVAAAASFQDWWLALKVAEVAELDWIDAPLVSYRLHGGNMASGADGEKWARNVRADLRFRRWMPTGLDLRGVAAAELRTAAERLEHDAGVLARRMGTSVPAELAAGEEHRRGWATALVRSRAARDAGAAHPAAVHALAAVLADPAAPESRADLVAALERLERVETAAVAGPADAPFVLTTDPAARLAAAEARFAGGDAAGARRELETLGAEYGLPAELVAQVRSDLAVLAVADGCLGTARREALAALQADPGYAPAAETLGRCSEAEGDDVQAAHWFERALALEPGDASLTAAAAAAAARRSPSRVTRPGVTGGEEAGAAGRALICVDYFHPSVGGSERLAEQLGSHLRARGWHVEIATRALPERRTDRHLGMRIHEVRRPAEDVARLAARGRHDAILALSDPRAWPVPVVAGLPRGAARRVVVPCINPENLAHLESDPGLLQAYAGLVRHADAHVHSSLRGLDARLAAQLGLASTYIPNGAARVEPAAVALPPGGAPLALVVGNLWPEKNHLALLAALAGHRGAWRLALAGAPAPAQEALAARIDAVVAVDDRMHRLGPLSPGQVAAAMRAADVLLLPSLAEATPLVLVEAMAHGLPWIATPTCGAAHDHAGGLILPVRDMGAGLDFLLADHPARAALGAAGREHWQAAYDWDVVAGRYDAVLRGAVPPADPATVTGAHDVTAAVRARQFDALASPPPPFSTATPGVRSPRP